MNILLLHIQFCIFTLIAILLRKGMRKIPKVYSYMLWIFVFTRLLWPFGIDSEIGVIPEKNTVMTMLSGKSDGMHANAGENMNEVAVIQNPVSEKQPVLTKEKHVSEGNPEPFHWQNILPAVWLTGTVCILLYNLLALRRMRKYLMDAECTRENIYVSRKIKTPFTLGVRNVRIYLPDFLGAAEQEYIICHEKIHIRRKDYLVKSIAFLLAGINWFNPFVWIAFHFMEQDMEMSCDEEVIHIMGNGIKKEYSQSLLDFATGDNDKALTPVTFGSVSVRKRVGNVLTKKNAKKWVGFAAMTCCVAGLTAALFVCTPRTIKGTSDTLLSGRTGAVKEEVNTFMKEWTNAFSERNYDYITVHTSDKAKAALEKEELLVMDDDMNYFGWSSPWPSLGEDSYRIIQKTNNEAEILYYAWTSDPHYTVWSEKVTFEKKGSKDYVITSESTSIYDQIASKEDFYKAYPDGKIAGTPMDYMLDGTAEALNSNATGESKEYYTDLLKADTAAVNLLNLSDKKSQVKVKIESQKDGKAVIAVTFKKDNSKVKVNMIQPFGKKGIWIPQ